MSAVGGAHRREGPQSAYRTHDREIDGALFTVAIPPVWDGRLLLIAHGYRPPEAPLVPGFDSEYAPYRSLLADGWMVVHELEVECVVRAALAQRDQRG